MSEKKWIVYCHTNKINGKRYVGITCQNPFKRWKRGEGYKSSPHFYSAIKKYGWDNFDHEILFNNFNEKEAKLKEQELIFDWNLQDNRCGYNITNGGDGVSGYVFSEEQRCKMSERMKGQNHPFYHKKMPKSFCDAISRGRKGIHFSQSHIKNLSQSHLGKTLSQKTKEKISNSLKKSVICLETEQVFPGISDISNFYGKDASVVREQGKLGMDYIGNIMTNT